MTPLQRLEAWRSAKPKRRRFDIRVGLGLMWGEVCVTMSDVDGRAVSVDDADVASDAVPCPAVDDIIDAALTLWRSEYPKEAVE